jgi:hypothetical protein
VKARHLLARLIFEGEAEEIQRIIQAYGHILPAGKPYHATQFGVMIDIKYNDNKPYNSQASRDVGLLLGLDGTFFKSDVGFPGEPGVHIKYYPPPASKDTSVARTIQSLDRRPENPDELSFSEAERPQEPLKPKRDDLARPVGLSHDGNKAYDVIMAFLKSHDMTNTGGCRAFYSPQEWQARKETYGLKSVLIVSHDGGELAAVFNMDYEMYDLCDEMNQTLAASGLMHEPCTTWYTAVYPTGTTVPRSFQQNNPDEQSFAEALIRYNVVPREVKWAMTHFDYLFKKSPILATHYSNRILRHLQDCAVLTAATKKLRSHQVSPTPSGSITTTLALEIPPSRSFARR